jgi:N-carbamoyl-L-amino-acid hydrolase
MPAPLIDRDRFLENFAAMARIGATPDGGVHRLAASAADGAARDLLAAWLTAMDMRVHVDAIGNMAGILDLAGQDAPLVMAGSHLDSQPNGGRFDGALGVVAACEGAAVLRAATATRWRCNLAVVNWTGEEGARFQPSLLGSSVFAGTLPLNQALARLDRDGMSAAAALDAIGYRGADALPRPDAYLELHIECGPELERAGASLGRFTGYWGAVKQRVAFIGAQAHTGPTPMAMRRDALLGAAYLIAALREMTARAPGVLHTSCGRIDVSPNSPNVVPAEAELFVELRALDPAALAWAEDELATQATAAADRAGVGLEWRATERRPAGRFDTGLLDLCAEEAEAIGAMARDLSTVPGHDAISIAGVCPAAMLVVPSVRGICHHPEEFTQEDDLVLGTEVLTRALWRLCQNGVAP